MKASTTCTPSTPKETPRAPNALHMRRSSRSMLGGSLIVVLLITYVVVGCVSPKARKKEQLIYSAAEFRAALIERVPSLNESLAEAPFIVRPEDIELAEARILEARIGPERVRALVRSLSLDPPEGFGLQYHWLASSNARRTIASRQGNCVALASVLVGLGRGLGWPIYYAEARSRRPETREFEEVTFVSDHMVVIVAAKSFQMIIDFTGQVDSLYDVHAIDDLTAYAHLINNIAGQHIARIEGESTDEDWRIALQGFELASQIQPALGRAWNNRGIALTRLKRYDEAKIAYEQALTLDPDFDSASHNLEIMRTRALGETIVAEEPISR